jgi:hypothetical protein
MNRTRQVTSVASFALVLTLAFSANAAFVIEIDIDGINDGAFILNPNFSFGGDTTTAATSIPSPAFGLVGGNSIFGGDGVVEPDTYLYSYAPDAGDADNLVAPAGTALNTTGDVATGMVGGAPGLYAVYAAWPQTTGVSGGLSTFDLYDKDNTLIATTAIDQNGLNGLWVKLFEVNLLFDPDDAIDEPFLLRQQAGANTFVSQRGAGVLFELVREIPEPSSSLLMITVLASFCLRGAAK